MAIGKKSFKCSSVCNEEDNLKRLAKSNVISNFVKENNGCWDHEKWLGLCDTIQKKGYSPIDFDKVGLMLEEKKASYLANRQ